MSLSSAALRPRVVCLTPVKNEAWILERFLLCASTWADHIVLADQGSTDASLTIAAGFPKVHIIRNENPNYDEASRQKLLIQAARQHFSSPRLLVALDADEVLSGNFQTSKEWPVVLSSLPGTVINFRWANLRPGLKQAWLSADLHPWAFMDDGSEHSGEVIHNPRVPVPAGAPHIHCEEIRILHYQYADQERMRSKHRWYQCFERVRNPRAGSVRLFEEYHHMLRVADEDLVPVRPEWFQYYETQGINMKDILAPPDGIYWWDALVLDYMRQYGPHFFARENIWSDWPRVAARLGADGGLSRDPRNAFQKQLHRFLLHPKTLRNAFPRKLIKSMLKRIY